MRHKKTVMIDGCSQEKTWEVDTNVVVKISGNDWLADYPQLLLKDLDEMQAAFPHWIVVAGNGTSPAACATDQEFIVPANGDMRCVKCGKKYVKSVSSLIWTGMIPVQITGAERVEHRIRDLVRSRTIKILHVDQGKALFVLPAVKVIYPTNWPHQQPEAHYFPGFFETLEIGVSGASHSNHMNNSTKMCLFSAWHQMSIREVIQNRILPHALAQVKIANGERPQKWFN